MPRHVAFLRGVSPSNASMPRLKQAFEAAGFTEVRTLLSSGNVIFRAPRQSPTQLARRAEESMQRVLGRTFGTIVWTVEALAALVATDPFAAFPLPAGAKTVVTFLRHAPVSPPPLPLAADGARLLALRGTVLLTAYVPHPKGARFMLLIERTFGREVTTRTWNTLQKCVRAGQESR